MIYFHLQSDTPCALHQITPKYSLKERNCLDNVDILTSQLSLGSKE